LVSHDNDFLNDVTTDIIEFHTIEKKLYYYRGNYNQFLVLRQQKDQAQIHQVETLQKKEMMMQQVLNNIRSQPVHTSRGAKKKAKTINCHKKKMEKVLYNTETTIASANNEAIQHVLRRSKYEDEPDKKCNLIFGTVLVNGMNQF
jgi:ATPase subunit of ABC transporter with duplicated ATPase domains